MATDYMTLGPVPAEESCQQIGPTFDPVAARAEERRYKKQLEDRFPVPANVRGRFAIKSFPHDFGTYREVCVIFDDEDEASTSWAYFVESHLPGSWDDFQVFPYVKKEETDVSL